MKPEVFIANRYLSTTRNSFSVSILKWIGMIGVGVGVFSLIVVISVMRGFERDFERKILGFQAPVLLEIAAADAAKLPDLETLKQHNPLVKDAERRIEGELVIESAFGTSSGARVRGIDKPLSDMVGVGELQLISPVENPLKTTDEDLPGVVLGTELAAHLQVHPDFKDIVRLVFPFGDISPSGEVLPRIRRFRVVGLFDSGFYEYDSKFALVSEGMANRLFGEYGRASLALYLENNSKSQELKKHLLATYQDPPWSISTWEERNQRLFQALLLERLGMFVLLSMIVLIATFNIFALLSMLVLEKIPDMAVLRTMGFRLKDIRRLFLWHVGKIGLRGTMLGGVAAIGVCLYLYFFPYELPPTYYIEHLPISFEPLNIILMMALGPVISVLAGIYPARQATKPVIAEVLRYE